MIPIYYVLYKIKNTEILWVVKTSDNINDFFKLININDLIDEKYYLVERPIYKENKETVLERQHFKIFNLRKNDTIIDDFIYF
tara:strand:- start:139 stop:387 length:249 start_codon:yes stop_codon:yes gene_type:complete